MSWSSHKIHLVLRLIFLCFLAIFIRIWYLAIIQHDSQVEQAIAPRRREVIEPVERAPIRDRFGISLAINQMQYNAAISYADIRTIPRIVWKKNGMGKEEKIYARAEHITTLSKKLALELNLDPVQIEDVIQGKAALFPHTPFALKEDISESEYYRLRMLEKDFPGIQTQRVTRRSYPQGKVACDILGYLGKISREKYVEIAREMRELEEFLTAYERKENPLLLEGFETPSEAYSRFQELREKAYTINDFVGKAGVESFYEEELRGELGRKLYEIDVKGNFLRELPGSREAKSGKPLILSISCELQRFAESLLAAWESPHKAYSIPSPLHYWKNGGAIVAMIPKTGEVVALASYPRFDPNDFIPSKDLELNRKKGKRVRKWLEGEGFLGEVWDGKQTLDREYFSLSKGGTGAYAEEKQPLTWPSYLSIVLPGEGSVRRVMDKITTLKMACAIQEKGISHPFLEEISHVEDRQLVLDLCKLGASQGDFPLPLIGLLGEQSLATFHLFRQATLRAQEQIKWQIQELYHELDFSAWRQTHFTTYLKGKRTEEKREKKYLRPYTDYLDEAEKKMFAAFWAAYRWVFVYTGIRGSPPLDASSHPALSPYLSLLKGLHTELLARDPTLHEVGECLISLGPLLGTTYLRAMRSFAELTSPLIGQYNRVRRQEGQQLEKHLASAFFPPQYGYGSSHAFRQLSASGSTFKLITTYQDLMERYLKKEPLNHLTLIDDLKGDPKSTSSTQLLGYTLDGTPILRNYKGGRLPRSSHAGMGRIDLLGALEQSSNIYFSILAAEHLADPLHLAQAAQLFGYGAKTGIDLPGEPTGHVPDDISHNRTALYSLAIGQHSLTVTPLQTAVMAATIANRGVVVQPHVAMSPTKIRRQIPFPPEVHSLISEGMRRAVMGSRGTARPEIMRNFYDSPNEKVVQGYLSLHRDILAKTGTAQLRYKQTLDRESLPEMVHNISCVLIAYPHDKSGKLNDPELVVVVFLRFRTSGRDAAPLAAQVIQEWRRISALHLGQPGNLDQEPLMPSSSISKSNVMQGEISSPNPASP